VRIQGLRIDHDLILKRGHVLRPPEGTPMPNIAVGQEDKADLELRRRKITGIVLAGTSTSIGVESAARALTNEATT
jgi:hypothetical protein